MNLPNLFIVGAPKCGTTAMHIYLSQHPEIFMSIEKEPFYFHVTEGEGERPQYHRYRGDLEKYLKLFSAAIKEKYIGESSPGYLASAIASKEIYDFNPKAKIVIMLREPGDLLLSTYYHHKFMGVETRKKFDDAILEEFSMLNVKEKRPVHPIRYFDLCHYAKWIKTYIDQFGRENVHIILYDDLKKGVHDTYRELLRFLDVDEDFVPEFKIVNKRKFVRSKLLQKTLSLMHLSPHQLKDNKIFIRFRSILPLGLDIFLINFGKRIYSKENNDINHCSDKSISLIRSHFKSEICELEEIIGRNLSGWKFE
jgi:hypothetical protein